MNARSIGSATISFGLVSVPVKLYSAAQPAANISFNLVHSTCGTRLKQQYYCPRDEVVVDRDEIARGYEFAKGQYVLFSDEELKALNAPGSESIDIAEFVPLDRVERTFVEKFYYLGPDKGGDRPYRLLAAALQETGLAAVAQYSARGNQYLVLIRPLGEGLIMEQLRYADEIRPMSEVPLGRGEVKGQELKLAVQLVEQSASDEFKPEQYEDEVRKRVLEQIQRKVEGEEITAVVEHAPEVRVIDLMEALKASLAKSEQGDVGERKPTRRAPSRAGKRAAEKGGAAKKKKRASGS